MNAWRPPRPRHRLDLTPLIDVVFMLLLFLIVAAQFDQSSSLPLQLPTDSKASSTPTHPLVISLNAEGTFIDGNRVDDAGTEAVRRGGLSHSIVVQADAGLTYERVFQVLASLGRAGMTHVSLAYQTKP